MRWVLSPFGGRRARRKRGLFAPFPRPGRYATVLPMTANVEAQSNGPGFGIRDRRTSMSALDRGLAGHSINSERPERPSRVGRAESSPPRLVSDMHDTRRTARAVDRRSQRCDDPWAGEARREAELDYRVTPALGWCGPIALVGAGRRVAPNDVTTTDVFVTGRWRGAVRWIGSGLLAARASLSPKSRATPSPSNRKDPPCPVRPAP